jgi:hypothetical protein
MGAATRRFNFYGGKKLRFIAIGVPGMVGVLSGMVPGSYSVTLNWAPPPEPIPSFQWGPAFLLRAVLDQCSSYDHAVYCLKEQPLSTSAFFTVCGAKSACVIERTPEGNEVRHGGAAVMTQSNHFQTSAFEYYNCQIDDIGDRLMKTSRDRAPNFAERLEAMQRNPPQDLQGWSRAFSADSVTNDETIQRMVFCPATGDCYVERLA